MSVRRMQIILGNITSGIPVSNIKNEGQVTFSTTWTLNSLRLHATVDRRRWSLCPKFFHRLKDTHRYTKMHTHIHEHSHSSGPSLPQAKETKSSLSQVNHLLISNPCPAANQEASRLFFFNQQTVWEFALHHTSSGHQEMSWRLKLLVSISLSKGSQVHLVWWRNQISVRCEWKDGSGSWLLVKKGKCWIPRGCRGRSCVASRDMNWEKMMEKRWICFLFFKVLSQNESLSPWNLADVPYYWASPTFSDTFSLCVLKKHLQSSSKLLSRSWRFPSLGRRTGHIFFRIWPESRRTLTQHNHVWPPECCFQSAWRHSQWGIWTRVTPPSLVRLHSCLLLLGGRRRHQEPGGETSHSWPVRMVVSRRLVWSRGVMMMETNWAGGFGSAVRVYVRINPTLKAEQMVLDCVCVYGDTYCCVVVFSTNFTRFLNFPRRRRSWESICNKEALTLYLCILAWLIFRKFSV